MTNSYEKLSITVIGLLVLWAFTSFNSYITEDLIWFNNSDQNGWIIFSSLDFNDGKQSQYISHPGVVSSFTYGWGYKFMELIGQVDVSKSSDFIDIADPISKLPQLYTAGSKISIILIILCSLIMGAIIYLGTFGKFLYSVYGAALTLMSTGFLFHSIMLRNELTSVYYLMLAILLFVIPYRKFTSGTLKNTVYSGHDSILDSMCYLVSGFCFGMAYFSKSQVVLTAILFFAYLLFSQFSSRSHSLISKNKAFVFVLGHIISFVILFFGFNITLPIFWKLIYGLFLLISLLVLLFHKSIENPLVSFFSIITRFSLGFTAVIPYVLVRGLKGDARAQEKVLNITSFWDPNATSIQAQALDKEFSSISARFLYFMQSYFVESILIISVFLTIYLFTKKDEKWKSYAVGLVLIMAACYINSMRSNLTMNLGRSVFKYIIYVDVAVIMLIVMTYVDAVKLWKGRRRTIHAIFWALLILSSANNLRKVKNHTNWDWTTYADIVYPERWLFPGTPPSIRKIMKEKYQGFVNGHDRVIFGDELPRTGSIEIPGGEKHLKRVQKLSTEPYLNRMERLFELDSDGVAAIKDMESRILAYKLKIFLDGDDYMTIVRKATEKRKFLYSKTLDAKKYAKYLSMVEQGRLTVPF